MKIKNAHLKALVSLTDKTDTRYYVNQIHVEGNLAYASNSVIALRVPAPQVPESVTLRADKVEVQRKVTEVSESSKLAKINNKQKRELEVDLSEVERGQNYPPLTGIYATVEDSRIEKIEVSYNLDQLIALLQAIKQGSNKNEVKFILGAKHRPLILESDELTGLIVPCRY